MIRAISIIVLVSCMAAWSWGQGAATSTQPSTTTASGEAATNPSGQGLEQPTSRKSSGLDAAGAPLGPITSLALTADAQTVLAGCEDGRLHIWQVQGDKVRTLVRPDWPSKAPASSPTTTSAPAKAAGPATQPADPRRLYRLAISPDGSTVAACDELGVYLWDLPQGKYLGKLDVPAFRSVRFSRDSRQVTTVGDEMDQVTWNLSDRSVAAKSVRPVNVMTDNGRIIDEQPDDMGEYVAYLSTRRQFHGIFVSIIDTEHPGILQNIAVSSKTVATDGAVAMSHSGRYVAASSNDAARFFVRDLGKRTDIDIVRPHDRLVTALCFSGDDQWLVAGDAKGVISVWPASHWRPAAEKPVATSRAWKLLAEENTLTSPPNMWTLIDDGDKTTAFLKDMMAPVGDMDRAELDKLLADLDSDTFSVRKAAGDKLAAKVRANWPLLQEAREQATSLEVRTALGAVLAKVDIVTPNQEKYAVRILERIKTPAARNLLRTIADVKMETNLQKCARAGLARMGLGASSQPASMPASAPE